MKKTFLTIVFSMLMIISVNAQEVSVVSGGCTLKGTLEVPESSNHVDVVLIIAGSGPTDRNGNSTLLPGKNNSLKMLADTLYAHGIASLRYDKRGVGESVEGKGNESDLTFDTFVKDAVQWLKFLKKDRRFGKIIIAGHSEGSLIGMLAAEQVHADKYISLCGAGQPIYKILSEQLKANKLPDALLNQCDSIMDSLKQGKEVKDVSPSLYALFRPSVQPFLISWFKYDPAMIIGRITVPALIVEGTTDIQVSVKQAEILSQADKNSKLVIIKDMNHKLTYVPTLDRMKNAASYSNPDLPLSAELCKSIVSFIKS